MVTVLEADPAGAPPPRSGRSSTIAATPATASARNSSTMPAQTARAASQRTVLTDAPAREPPRTAA
jgi:hypothetical protein